MIELNDIHRINVDMGRQVLCDSCSKDFTDLPDEGGIQFQSKAICPECTPRWHARAVQYGETKFIRAICPDGVRFADWVRDELRRVDR